MTRALAEEQVKKLVENVPLGRLGRVDDIAQAVLFLCSPARGLHHRRDPARERRNVHGLRWLRMARFLERIALLLHEGAHFQRIETNQKAWRKSMDNIEARVKKIVAEQLGVAEADIKNESSFVEDLGADSLDNVELVMALEEEFECEIPDEEAEKITNVQQAIDYVKSHVKQ